MTKTPAISAVVLTHNEADNIKRCLESLLWCDEILLLDNSTDETVALAKKIVPVKKLHIHTTAETDFSALRNLGLNLATSDWVLFIDADEEVSDALHNEIRNAVFNSSVSAFSIERHDFFLGRWLEHGEARQRLVKLGKKSAGVWQRRVHEKWLVESTAHLKSPLYHYPHPSVGEFLDRINRWTDMDAQQFFDQGKRSSFIRILAYPLAKFMRNYFFKMGFLDGMPGLIMAIMMSFHSFLTRAKLYFLEKKTNVHSQS